MKKLRTLIPTLPIEIFYQHIFVNLPVKSLLRFKEVCRQWNDVIKEPNFVRIHLHHAQNKCQKLMIYTYPLHIFYSLDHQTISEDDDDYIQAVKLPFPIHNYPLPVPELTTIVGSVDGLVCISSSITDWYKTSIILVWNPTTRVHKILPPYPNVPVAGKHGIGFVYNSTADDYNVVRVVGGFRIDIYSLKNNSWKLFMLGNGIPGRSRIVPNRFRVCSLDGSIYWFACHEIPNGRILKDNFIACLDLNEVDDVEKKKKNLIREIEAPGDFDIVFGLAELKVMGGCLSLFKVGVYFGSLVIWSLRKINENKNDEVEHRWINMVVIREPSFLRQVNRYLTNFVPINRIGTSEPICFAKDGKIVLRIPGNSPTEFGLYNTARKLIKNLHRIQWISHRGICFWDKVPIEQSQTYIESLVSPNFMS